MLQLAPFIINTISASDLLNPRQRLRIYQQFGLQSESAQFYAHCVFSHTDLSRISIGKNTFVNYGVQFNNGAEITIGDGVDIAMNVQFITDTHRTGTSEKRAGWGCIRKPIRIGNGCWIGANALIMPGVTIADGCVVGAGALVNKDCAENGLYLGVPARRVKDLDMTAPYLQVA